MIINAPAVAAIEGWLRVTALKMHATGVHGQDRPLSPGGVDAGFGACYAPQRVLAIGQGQFFPIARGVVWGFRPWGRGKAAVPLDF